MRSAIAFVAATGAVAGVAAQTSPADCENNWTSTCDSSSFGFVVDPKIAHLPVCASDSDCVNDGLTNCGPGVHKDANGANTQVWLTAAGDLQSAIDNDIWSTAASDRNTCGRDNVQVLYQDPLTAVEQTSDNAADGTTTSVSVNQYTGCYALLAGETPALEGMPTGNPSYPETRDPTQTASCRVTENRGAPTCRCRATGTGSSGSQCKALYDAAQTGTTAERDFNAARFRAFKAINQCTHYTADTCASAQMCKYAGPNINKVCAKSTDSVKLDANGAITTDSSGTDTPRVSTCRVNYDPSTNVLLSPGSANERCSCDASHCADLWSDYQTKLDARDAAVTAAGTDNPLTATANRSYRCTEVVTGTNPCNAIDVLNDLNEEMTRLENAGQCVGGRPGSNATSPASPEYSMHIGLVAGIAAGSVALAALITSALVCILMYACRSESHVQTQARNQRAMAMGGGQSAVVYGRSGAEMEMTRRSRY